MDGKTLRSLNHLSVWYGQGHPVLSDFSLDLWSNEVAGLTAAVYWSWSMAGSARHSPERRSLPVIFGRC